jgi:hypothetical protein
MWRSVFRYFSIACLASSVLQLHAADAPRSLPIGAEPLVYERDGMVQGCGVRLTGGDAGRTAASSWFDVSFNVFRRGIALAQSFSYEIRPSGDEGDSTPKRVPVQSTWLSGAEGTVRRGENTEQRESLVYALGLDDALSLFEALAQGRPLRVGIKRWAQREDAVYTGAPELSSESRSRIGECLAGLSLERAGGR